MKCDMCGKTFTDEWKFNAHKQNHMVYHGCDLCEKTFKYQETLKKHMTAVHATLKIYCHFYNNDKDCPFKEECIFIHGDSEVCKFIGLCERNLCMFKHKHKEVIKDNSEQIEIVEETTDDERIDDTGESDESDDEILKDEPVETLEYDIFVPCREHFLTKDQQFYFQSFNGMKEIGRMQEMWIKPKDGYQVGTYL